MFDWYRRRLVKKMSNLTNVAQLVVAISLTRDYYLKNLMIELSKVDMEADISGIDIFMGLPGINPSMGCEEASAISNYLFGKTSDPIHTQKFDLPKLYQDGHQWLRDNNLFREIVVQSLRVMNTVEYADSSIGNILGEEFLVKYGAEYPSLPSPNIYEALIEKGITSLAPVDRKRVQLWRQTGR